MKYIALNRRISYKIFNFAQELVLEGKLLEPSWSGYLGVIYQIIRVIHFPRKRIPFKNSSSFMKWFDMNA
jgi:hypothetical protein